MDFEQLFVLGDASIKNALHVRPRNVIHNDFALLKSEIKPTEPIVFDYSMGKDPKELISTEHPILYLLADQVFQVFKENQFTGWASYPVEIYGKNGENIKGYQGFSVYGSCSSIDNSKSKIILKSPPSPNGKPYEVWSGLFFNLETWDGNDIFVPNSTGFIIVTERVKDSIENAGFNNFSFRRLTEIERRSHT